MTGDRSPFVLTIEGLMPAQKDGAGGEVVSWSWSETQSGGVSYGSGLSAGRVQMTDLMVLLRPDPSTPRLFPGLLLGGASPKGRAQR
jgi:hypothetical protein